MSRRVGIDRSNRSKEAAKRILGVGYKVIDQALKQAKDAEACVTTLPIKILKEPIIVFQIEDRITTEGRTVRKIVAGVRMDSGRKEPTGLLRDWQLLEELIRLTEARGNYHGLDHVTPLFYVPGLAGISTLPIFSCNMVLW